MVENPRTVVALPNFVSQHSGSKSIKETPKEPKVQCSVYHPQNPHKHPSFFYSMRSLLSDMQTQILSTKTLPKSVNNMQKSKPPESKLLIYYYYYYTFGQLHIN